MFVICSGWQHFTKFTIVSYAYMLTFSCINHYVGHIYTICMEKEKTKNSVHIKVK